MANFNLDNPFTFKPSLTNFAGAAYYDVSVVPDDPSKYKGPSVIRVSSNSFLTENQILEIASDIALSRSRYGYEGTPLDLTVTSATINNNLIPEI